MTSLRQIEANRHNALKSTGPKTENGKQRSRRNALRHGFTAETVIEPLESRDEYRAFEAAILREYLRQTPVEQVPAARLALLATAPGNADRNRVAADAKRDSPSVSELPPKESGNPRGGGCLPVR